jgi:hypothetical protein
MCVPTRGRCPARELTERRMIELKRMQALDPQIQPVRAPRAGVPRTAMSAAAHAAHCLHY